MVRRRRSDGDGRRSYLTLAWDNPIVAATAAHGAAPHGARVVFVCSANSARSQMAASLLARAAHSPVASAGTAPADAIHPLALAELERARPRPARPARPRRPPTSCTDGDIVVAVCDNAYEDLGPANVALHWSVPDPAHGNADAFRAAFDDLTPRIGRLADALTHG